MFIRIVVVVLIVSFGVVRSGPITSMTTTTDPPTLSTSTLTTTTTDPTIPDYTPESTTSQGACVDKLDTCGLLDPTFYCVGDYFNWAKENCETTCSLCGVTTTTLDPLAPVTTTTLDPLAPVCEYKDANYTQGETWYDGCDYNCTCEDASIGYYKCRNRCPVYTNLPPGCRLYKAAGECCATPDCGSQMIDGPDYWRWEYYHQHPTTGGISFCSYKGHYYTQDETWTDGCSQTCTCSNADEGMYSCRAVCLNWKNLPSMCHMDDTPPGLCCQQPRCPHDIVITIPKAYKNQYPGYVYV